MSEGEQALENCAHHLLFCNMSAVVSITARDPPGLEPTKFRACATTQNYAAACLSTEMFRIGQLIMAANRHIPNFPSSHRELDVPLYSITGDSEVFRLVRVLRRWYDKTGLPHVVIEGPAGRGTKMAVDLSRVKDYTLYPGAVVILRGRPSRGEGGELPEETTGGGMNEEEDQVEAEAAAEEAEAELREQSQALARGAVTAGIDDDTVGVFVATAVFSPPVPEPARVVRAGGPNLAPAAALAPPSQTPTTSSPGAPTSAAPLQAVTSVDSVPSPVGQSKGAAGVEGEAVAPADAGAASVRVKVEGEEGAVDATASSPASGTATAASPASATSLMPPTPLPTGTTPPPSSLSSSSNAAAGGAVAPVKVELKEGNGAGVSAAGAAASAERGAGVLMVGGPFCEAAADAPRALSRIADIAVAQGVSTIIVVGPIVTDGGEDEILEALSRGRRRAGGPMRPPPAKGAAYVDAAGGMMKGGASVEYDEQDGLLSAGPLAAGGGMVRAMRAVPPAKQTYPNLVLAAIERLRDRLETLKCPEMVCLYVPSPQDAATMGVYPQPAYDFESDEVDVVAANPAVVDVEVTHAQAPSVAVTGEAKGEGGASASGGAAAAASEGASGGAGGENDSAKLRFAVCGADIFVGMSTQALEPAGKLIGRRRRMLGQLLATKSLIGALPPPPSVPLDPALMGLCGTVRDGLDAAPDVLVLASPLVSPYTEVAGGTLVVNPGSVLQHRRAAVLRVPRRATEWPSDARVFTQCARVDMITVTTL